VIGRFQSSPAGLKIIFARQPRTGSQNARTSSWAKFFVVPFGTQANELSQPFLLRDWEALKRARTTAVDVMARRRWRRGGLEARRCDFGNTQLRVR
jgi:hypothetical protein